MSEELLDTNSNSDDTLKPVLIYRGISTANERDRKGVWWTTNPFYAFKASNGGKGEMFVAEVDARNLDGMAKDVSLEAEYQNYVFPDNDPPGARPVTTDEIEALKSASIPTEHSDIPGGELMEWPNNPVEIGQGIFRAREIGSIAIAGANEPQEG